MQPESDVDSPAHEAPPQAMQPDSFDSQELQPESQSSENELNES